MGNDDAKRLILARRARFVAAALASVTAASVGLTAGLEACGGNTEETDPRPCLKVAPTNDPPTDPKPQPCLSVEEDAGRDSDASSPQPCLSPPAPCLRIAPDAGEPQPCLSMPPPDASDK